MSVDLSRPAVLLRLEGAAVLALAVLLYRELGASWLMFVLLFLLPDLSIAAYLGGPKVGAAVYNAVHTYVLPAGIYAFGFVTARPVAMLVAVVWAAHIAGDRLLGFGLKFRTGFRDTHLHAAGSSKGDDRGSGSSLPQGD
jgi:hypothetical protein